MASTPDGPESRRWPNAKPWTEQLALSMKSASKAKKKSAGSESSPFLVDLVAENERIDEENAVRFREVTRRRKEAERRREAAKNEVILRALREGNELEDLRMEKRKILDEERRLRALIEIERANSHGKHDRRAAVLAEKRRHAAKRERRRKENVERLEEREEARMRMLIVKHNLKPREDDSAGGPIPAAKK